MVRGWGGVARSGTQALECSDRVAKPQLRWASQRRLFAGARKALALTLFPRCVIPRFICRHATSVPVCQEVFEKQADHKADLPYNLCGKEAGVSSEEAIARNMSGVTW